MMFFFSPIFFLVYSICFIESGKPLFIQKRLGKNKKPFYLIKFRTMLVNTPSVASHLVNIKSVTRFGKIIRSLKFDELPQIINVIKGEMSLVGPRPCLPSQTELIEYRENLKNHINNELKNTDLTFRLSGIMIILSEFIWMVIKSSLLSIGLSMLIIFIICTLFFKSWKFGFLSILPLASAVIVNFGLMGLLGIDLTHMTAILSSIIIGVGVDFSIHYTSEYRELLKSKKSNKTIKTINNVGHPIILDALSNMGFAALMLSAIIPLAQIGGLMVFAMVACSFGTLTLLASSIEYFKHKL